jgi:hypothetical protein
VGATVDRTNVVCKAQEVVTVRINAPLQRNFYLHIVTLTLHKDYLIMQRLLIAVHVGDVLADAAFIEIRLNVWLIALNDIQTVISKGDFTPPLRYANSRKRPDSVA